MRPGYLRHLGEMQPSKGFAQWGWDQPQPPVVYSFEPKTGGVGATITIQGSNFKNNYNQDTVFGVSFTGSGNQRIPATTFAIPNSAQITVTVPSGVIPGSIYLKSNQGDFPTQDKFYPTEAAEKAATEAVKAEEAKLQVDLAAQAKAREDLQKEREAFQAAQAKFKTDQEALAKTQAEVQKGQADVAKSQADVQNIVVQEAQARKDLMQKVMIGGGVLALLVIMSMLKK